MTAMVLCLLSHLYSINKCLKNISFSIISIGFLARVITFHRTIWIEIFPGNYDFRYCFKIAYVSLIELWNKTYSQFKYRWYTFRYTLYRMKTVKFGSCQMLYDSKWLYSTVTQCEWELRRQVKWSEFFLWLKLKYVHIIWNRRNENRKNYSQVFLRIIHL